jgi:hypothetical protein
MTENRLQKTKGRLFSALSHMFADTRHLTPETHCGLKPKPLSLFYKGDF